MGCLYYVSNAVNGKGYVGIVLRKNGSAEKRWRTHQWCARSERGFALHRAMRKHGIDNFTMRVLCVSADIALLKRREVLTIKLLNTKGPSGYNLTDGGDGTVGHKKTEKQRRKSAENRRGKLHSAETRRQMSEARKGHQVSVETRAKLSESNRRTKSGAEYKARLEVWNKGIPLAKARRTALSSQMKERWQDPAFREERRASFRRGWSDPRAKAQSSEQRKGRKLTEEHKAKIAASMKRHREIQRAA